MRLICGMIMILLGTTYLTIPRLRILLSLHTIAHSSQVMTFKLEVRGPPLSLSLSPFFLLLLTFLSFFIEPYFPVNLYNIQLDDTINYGMYLFFFREREFKAQDASAVSDLKLCLHVLYRCMVCADGLVSFLFFPAPAQQHTCSC